MNPRYAVGVDLGTTYTAAAVADGRSTRVVQLSGTSQTIPSVVSINGDTVLAGEAAERRLVTHPADTAREFKRRFGDPAPMVLGGATHGADVITSHLLREVLRRVEQAEGAPATAVGLSHPASWGPFRLDLLRETAGLAGVAHVELVPEPVAAAVANRDRVADGSLVAVYDLGGGTFDAAVVRREGDWSVVGTPEGVERLGGVDFDQAIMAHVDTVLDGQVFALDTADPEARSALMQLRSECQEAKEHLSQDTEVEIPVSLPNLRTSVRLTRAEFEAMVRPRLADSLAVLDRVVASAGVTWADIAQVLLVGGSSNIPAIGQAVSEHTGRPVTTATNPHLAIAVGTAAVTEHRLSTVEPAPTAPAIVATAETVEAAHAPRSAEPAPKRRSRVPLAVGGLVAAATITLAAVLVLGGGSDEADAEHDGSIASTAPVDTSDVVTSDDQSATTDPVTTDPVTTDPVTTDPAVAPPPDAIGVETCARDATGITDIASVDDAMFLLADGRPVRVDRASVAACAIDASLAVAGGFVWDQPVTHLAGAGRPLVLAGPGGGAVGLPGRSDVIACAPLTGVTTANNGTRYFVLDASGIVTVQLVGDQCTSSLVLAADEFAATSILAGRNRLVAGGSEPDGSPGVRLWDDQRPVTVTEADGGRPVFGSIDGLVGCAALTCVIDLATSSVHQIGLDAVVAWTRPIDTTNASITEVLATTTQDAIPYLLTRLDDGSTVILRLVL